MSQPLLSVNGLMMRFGGLLAVNNVNLELYPQEIVSLIGPNGAGKTTVFNCLTGFYKPTGGTILLRDQQVFNYRHFTEQTHMLEGAHHAHAGDLLPR